MGMLGAMYSGVSGLNVHGRALSTVADNIANINTHGYKATRANFGDVMVHSLTVGGSVIEQIGTGARILNIQTLMTQGSFESTDIPTDLAINGKGFFILRRTGTTTGQAQATYYSRAGQFLLDKQGYLVNPMGYRLQGYNVDDDGNLQGVVEDIRILMQQTDAIPTTQVDLSVNLNAEDSNTHHPSQAIDLDDTTSYNYMTSVRVYDSLGVGHDIALVFQRLSTYDGPTPSGSSSVWKVSTYENSGGTFTPTPDYPDNTFYLHFDTDGHLVGTSTGSPAYGDMYRSSGTVSSTSSEVSDRIGETLTYTGDGNQQTYITTVDIAISGTPDPGGADKVTIGSSTYTLTGANATEAAENLADAINADNGSYWATVSGSTVTVYGDGTTAYSVTETDASDIISISGDTLDDVINAIDNGRTATAAFYLNNMQVGDSVTVGSSTFVYGVDWTTISGLATAINASGEPVVASAVANNTLFLVSDSAGTSGNNVQVSYDDTNGSTIVLHGRSSSGSYYLAGGMDGTSTTHVDASGYNTGSAVALQLARDDTGSSATITIASSNTLGDSLGINYDSWTHVQYAADAQSNSTVETEGERTLTFDFPDATPDQQITFDFTPTASSASTQSAGANETFYLYQNGSPRGTLQSLDIDRTGLITGQFSNGTLRTLGAVVLADFANPNGLKREGDNLWSQTLQSGEPIINRPGEGGLGVVESGALEQSNVDLAQEFVKMINYQRAFQANSRTITTTDQMLQELINLKR